MAPVHFDSTVRPTVACYAFDSHLGWNLALSCQNHRLASMADDFSSFDLGSSTGLLVMLMLISLLDCCLQYQCYFYSIH